MTRLSIFFYKWSPSTKRAGRAFYPEDTKKGKGYCRNFFPPTPSHQRTPAKWLANAMRNLPANHLILVSFSSYSCYIIIFNVAPIWLLKKWDEVIDNLNMLVYKHTVRNARRHECLLIRMWGYHGVISRCHWLQTSISCGFRNGVSMFDSHHLFWKSKRSASYWGGALFYGA